MNQPKIMETNKIMSNKPTNPENVIPEELRPYFTLEEQVEINREARDIKTHMAGSMKHRSPFEAEELLKDDNKEEPQRYGVLKT